MKPYIFCHMMASIDGRIDCDMTEQIDDTDAYYEALDKMNAPSMLMGRVTMQMHYADNEPFTTDDHTPIGKTAEHIAQKAEGYMIAIDTHGQLNWSAAQYDGKPLLVITAEDCPRAYVDMLAKKGISWLAVGKKEIDLPQAMEILYSKFGVKRIALTGGGHINGAFLKAGLLDEVSIMIGAGIDGRSHMTAVFDGIDEPDRAATLLKLECVERVNEGTVWLRYTFASRK